MKKNTPNSKNLKILSKSLTKNKNKPPLKINHKTHSKSISNTKTNPKKQISKSETKVVQQKNILSKIIDETYTQMIKCKTKKSLTWKRTFLNMINRDKGIDLQGITNENLIPKSLNSIGSIMFQNYKFWFVYVEYVHKYLNLNKLINLISHAITFIDNKKDIKLLHILFGAKIKELKIPKSTIDTYCKTNHIIQKKNDKYYEYLLSKGGVNKENNIIDPSNIQNQKDIIAKKVKLENKRDQKENQLNSIKKKSNSELINSSSTHKLNSSSSILMSSVGKDDILKDINNLITTHQLKPIDEITPFSLSKQEGEEESNKIINIFDEKVVNEEIEDLQKIIKGEDDYQTPTLTPNKPSTNIIIPPLILEQDPSSSNNQQDPPSIIDINISNNLKEEDQKNNDVISDASDDVDEWEDSYVKYLREICAKRGDNPQEVLKFCEFVTPESKNFAKTAKKLFKTAPPGNIIDNDMNETNDKVYFCTFKYNIK